MAVLSVLMVTIAEELVTVMVAVAVLPLHVAVKVVVPSVVPRVTGMPTSLSLSSTGTMFSAHLAMAGSAELNDTASANS